LSANTFADPIRAGLPRILLAHTGIGLRVQKLPSSKIQRIFSRCPSSQERGEIKRSSLKSGDRGFFRRVIVEGNQFVPSIDHVANQTGSY